MWSATLPLQSTPKRFILGLYTRGAMCYSVVLTLAQWSSAYYSIVRAVKRTPTISTVLMHPHIMTDRVEMNQRIRKIYWHCIFWHSSRNSYTEVCFKIYIHIFKCNFCLFRLMPRRSFFIIQQSELKSHMDRVLWTVAMILFLTLFQKET